MAIRKEAAISKEKVTVVSRIESAFDNRLGNLVAKYLNEGYELMNQPVFTHLDEPSGFCGNAVGFKWPHFLVLFVKYPPAK